MRRVCGALVLHPVKVTAVRCIFTRRTHGSAHPKVACVALFPQQNPRLCLARCLVHHPLITIYGRITLDSTPVASQGPLSRPLGRALRPLRGVGGVTRDVTDREMDTFIANDPLDVDAGTYHI
jgi:hypothetical protein